MVAIFRDVEKKASFTNAKKFSLWKLKKTFSWFEQATPESENNGREKARMAKEFKVSFAKKKSCS